MISPQGVADLSKTDVNIATVTTGSQSSGSQWQGEHGTQGCPADSNQLPQMCGHCVRHSQRRAEGCGISWLPDSGIFSAPCYLPPLTLIPQKGNDGESPPLAKKAQGEVLRLSRPKARKMNGQGWVAQKPSPLYPCKDPRLEQDGDTVFEA